MGKRRASPAEVPSGDTDAELMRDFEELSRQHQRPVLPNYAPREVHDAPDSHTPSHASSPNDNPPGAGESIPTPGEQFQAVTPPGMTYQPAPDFDLPGYLASVRRRDEAILAHIAGRQSFQDAQQALAAANQANAWPARQTAIPPLASFNPQQATPVPEQPRPRDMPISASVVAAQGESEVRLRPVSRGTLIAVGAVTFAAVVLPSFVGSSLPTQQGCSQAKDWLPAVGCWGAGQGGKLIQDVPGNPRNVWDGISDQLRPDSGEKGTSTNPGDKTSVPPRSETPAQPEVPSAIIDELNKELAVKMPLGSVKVDMNDGKAGIDYDNGKKSVKFPMKAQQTLDLTLQPKTPDAKLAKVTREADGMVVVTYNTDGVGIVTGLTDGTYKATGTTKSGYVMSATGQSPNGSIGLNFLTKLPKGAAEATSKATYAMPTRMEQAEIIAQLYNAKYTAESVNTIVANKCIDTSTGAPMSTDILSKKINDSIRDKVTAWAVKNNNMKVKLVIGEHKFNANDILNRSAKEAEGRVQAALDLKAVLRPEAKVITVAGTLGCTPDPQLTGR